MKFMWLSHFHAKWTLKILRSWNNKITATVKVPKEQQLSHLWEPLTIIPKTPPCPPCFHFAPTTMESQMRQIGPMQMKGPFKKPKVFLHLVGMSFGGRAPVGPCVFIPPSRRYGHWKHTHTPKTTHHPLKLRRQHTIRTPLAWPHLRSAKSCRKQSPILF